MTRESPYDRLLTRVRAGATVVNLASHEWQRVRGLALGLARDLGLPLRAWSQSAGLCALDERGRVEVLDEAATDPVEVLRGIVAAGPEMPAFAEGGAVLLMEDVHPFLDHHPVVRWVREACHVAQEPRRVVLLATLGGPLPADLAKEVPTVEIPLPGPDDLRRVLRAVAAEQGVGLAADDEPLIDAARGLTVMEARLAFGAAAVRLGHLGLAAVPEVAAEKKHVIRRQRALSFEEADATLDDVGGLERVKRWLSVRRLAFGADARAYGVEAPRGILLLGVPGGGKSLLARVVARSWRLPLLRFDPGAVFAGIVGESEQNVREALRVAEALAPCVLWIDEIEKGLSGVGSSGQTDGGTAARVVGTLLSWMQDRTAPVFVVATANRIDMLPPELLRKGRFDEIFFVDLPTAAERRQILAIHLRRRGRDPADFDLEGLAAATAGFTGAELEQAVREALVDAFAEGVEVADAHILASARATWPLSRTMGDQLDALRRWARARARMAGAGEPEALPARGGGVPVLRQEAANPFIPQAGSAGREA